MERGGNPPAQFEHSISSTVQTDATHPEVGAEVYPIWWDKDGGGTSLHGSSHPWRFTTHDDNGWQIEQVDPYPWCDGYVPGGDVRLTNLRTADEEMPRRFPLKL